MRPTAVICGSLHRELPELKRQFLELETTGFRVLSPLSLDLLNTNDAVVKARHEAGFSVAELEKYHLRAIQEADIVWLHAPDGYVGTSGSFELGYAVACSKKIFGFSQPKDEMLVGYVQIVRSVFEALEVSRLVET